MIKVVDLFSGIGGFSLGLEKTGKFKTVHFCEIDEYCKLVLRKHWPSVKIDDDIKKLYLPSMYADVITSGFPCQDISSQGNCVGLKGERSGLWKETKRIISEVRPRVAILENVTNLLSGERGAWFGELLGDLVSIGYDCEWHCIPASSVGAPHRRDRVWVIAHPVGLGLSGQRELSKPSNKKKDEFREADNVINAFQKKQLPFVCRRHDGVSSKLDRYRLKGLGNAVCPQVVEHIGEYIAEKFFSGLI